MSDKRITRTQAHNNDELRVEIEEYNPFAPRYQLPRGEEEKEEILSNNSTSGSDQDKNTVDDLGSYSENSSNKSSDNSSKKSSHKFSSKLSKNKIF